MPPKKGRQQPISSYQLRNKVAVKSSPQFPNVGPTASTSRQQIRRDSHDVLPTITERPSESMFSDSEEDAEIFRQHFPPKKRNIAKSSDDEDGDDSDHHGECCDCEIIDYLVIFHALFSLTGYTSEGDRIVYQSSMYSDDGFDDSAILSNHNSSSVPTTLSSLSHSSSTQQPDSQQVYCEEDSLATPDSYKSSSSGSKRGLHECDGNLGRDAMVNTTTAATKQQRREIIAVDHKDRHAVAKGDVQGLSTSLKGGCSMHGGVTAEFSLKPRVPAPPLNLFKPTGLKASVPVKGGRVAGGGAIESLSSAVIDAVVNDSGSDIANDYDGNGGQQPSKLMSTMQNLKKNKQMPKPAGSTTVVVLTIIRDDANNEVCLFRFDQLFPW